MTPLWLSVVLLVAATGGNGETACWRLGEGISRPLPFPSDPDAQQPRFAAKAQDWVALVHIPPQELAAPTEVQVELFCKGKKKGERTLLLRGRLGQSITATKSDGSKVQVGLLAAAVSPDGELIALLSGLKILAFRGEEFVGAVDGGFFPAMVLSRQSLLWCPWAHEKGDALLLRWSLDPSEKPQAALLHDREGEVGKKMVAVRHDGLLWVVDAFTAEPWLVAESGVVKKRLDALRARGRFAGAAGSVARQLEEKVPPEARDATRRPPQVALFPVAEDPWVSDAYAMGNDLLVVSDKEPDKLYWLADDSRVWQCLQLPSAGSAAERFSLTVTSEGFWVSSKTGAAFFSADHLHDLRRQQERKEDASVKQDTAP